MRDDPRQYFSSKRPALVELLSRLIAARSVNPPGDECRPAAVAEDFLAQRGIAYEKYEREPGRTNLVISIGSGSPVLGVVAHLDTVPAGEGWRTDPFEAVVKDDTVVGRGACDNKGVAAALLLLAEYLSCEGPPTRGTFQVILAADEEHGSRLGMEYLLSESLIGPDAVLVPDAPDHMRCITVSEKGALFLRLRAEGVQAHGSTPEKGENAILRMKTLLDHLTAIRFDCEPSPLHSPPTINVGCIRGGDAPNMVPAWCEAEVDVRYIPGMKTSDVLEKVDAAIARASEATGENCFSRRVISDLPPSSVARDCLLARLIRASALEVLGFEPQPTGLSGATVAKQLVFSGIDAVGFTPGDPAAPHAANEWVEIGELLDFAAVTAALCRRFFGGK